MARYMLRNNGFREAYDVVPTGTPTLSVRHQESVPEARSCQIQRYVTPVTASPVDDS